MAAAIVIFYSGEPVSILPPIDVKYAAAKALAMLANRRWDGPATQVPRCHQYQCYGRCGGPMAKVA